MNVFRLTIDVKCKPAMTKNDFMLFDHPVIDGFELSTKSEFRTEKFMMESASIENIEQL